MAMLAGLLLTACSGAGDAPSGSAPTLTSQINALAAVASESELGSVSVLVDLGSTEALGTTAVAARQSDFLNRLEAASLRLQCPGGSAMRASVRLPASTAVVGLVLNECELRALQTLPEVQQVTQEIELNTQLSAIDQAVIDSYNGVEAWPATLDGQAVDFSGLNQVVAVLDTGVESTHPALGNRVLQGACFSTLLAPAPSATQKGFCPNQAASDTASANAGQACTQTLPAGSSNAARSACAHGTAMAGAAAMGSSAGQAEGGIARSASILPVQVFRLVNGGVTSGSTDLLMALEWTAAEAERRRLNNLPRIVSLNMSLGGGAYAKACDNNPGMKPFVNAVTQLRNAGVLTFAASGNEGLRGFIAFPACLSQIVSVGASTLGAAGVAAFSNVSPQVDLFAIGGPYNLPVPGAAWNESLRGTSPATALASGAVAALTTAAPGKNAQAIENALLLGNNLTVSGFNVTRPGLHIASAARALLGLPAEAPMNPPPQPTPAPSQPVPVITATGEVCFTRSVELGSRSDCYGAGINLSIFSAYYAGITTNPVGIATVCPRMTLNNQSVNVTSTPCISVMPNQIKAWTDLFMTLFASYRVQTLSTSQAVCIASDASRSGPQLCLGPAGSLTHLQGQFPGAASHVYLPNAQTAVIAYAEDNLMGSSWPITTTQAGELKALSTLTRSIRVFDHNETAVCLFDQAQYQGNSYCYPTASSKSLQNLPLTVRSVQLLGGAGRLSLCSTQMASVSGPRCVVTSQSMADMGGTGIGYNTRSLLLLKQ